MPDRVIDDGVKIQALSYLSVGLKAPQVSLILKISESQLYRLRKKAIERDWEGIQTSPILLSYVQDAPRSGRPTKQTPEVLSTVDEYIDGHGADGAPHQSLEELAYNVGISASIIKRILKKLGFKNLKITTKPGLTKSMLIKRLQWCQSHLGWTDETSVVLGQQRGRRRVWRKSGRGSEVKVARIRWKSVMVFMFWGCLLTIKKVLAMPIQYRQQRPKKRLNSGSTGSIKSASLNCGTNGSSKQLCVERASETSQGRSQSGSSPRNKGISSAARAASTLLGISGR